MSDAAVSSSIDGRGVARVTLNRPDRHNAFDDSMIAELSAAFETIAGLLEEELDVRGVAVVIEATHTCMTIRGIKKPGSLCVTSAMRGKFRESASSRAEVMHLMMDVRRNSSARRRNWRWVRSSGGDQGTPRALARIGDAMGRRRACHAALAAAGRPGCGHRSRI